jgi:putative tricarboxylic transport membrane protein
MKDASAPMVIEGGFRLAPWREWRERWKTILRSCGIGTFIGILPGTGAPAASFIAYADAEHAFTNPAADDYGIDGVSYDRRADRRSWEHMQTFFNALLDEDDQ